MRATDERINTLADGCGVASMQEADNLARDLRDCRKENADLRAKLADAVDGLRDAEQRFGELGCYGDASITRAYIARIKAQPAPAEKGVAP